MTCREFDPTQGLSRRAGILMALLLIATGAGLALAMAPPAASGELILLPEMLSFRDMRSQLELDVVMRAAVREHPDLLEGPRRDGFYRLDIALNADGSVYRSAVAFFPGVRNGSTSSDRFDLHRIIPWAGSINAGVIIQRGESVGGAGIAPNQIEINYGFLPVNYDPSRAAERVEGPVREHHAELIKSYPGGGLNGLTVLMSEDGRIARMHVARIDRERISQWWTPPADFSVLGLDAEQLGPNGMYAIPLNPRDTTTPAPFHIGAGRDAEGELAILLVHYAWPRREGEPAGGPPLSRGTQIPELRAPTITEQLASRYCSGAMAAAGEAADVCWIAFTREGRVVRAGQFGSDVASSEMREQLRSLNPELDLTDIKSERVRYPTGDRQVRMLLAWGVVDTLGVPDRSSFRLR